MSGPQETHLLGLALLAATLALLILEALELLGSGRAIFLDLLLLHLGRLRARDLEKRQELLGSCNMRRLYARV